MCSFIFQPRKTDISLKSPGTKPSYLQSRLSITSQTTLKRSTSQASAIFLPDSDMFPSSPSPSTPRTPLSSVFVPPDPVSQTIPETPFLEDSEPDYVNIENFPEKEPPPDIPPRKPASPPKPRASSVNGERSSTSENVTSPVRRQMSMIIPGVPRVPPKALTLVRFPDTAQDNEDAPPIPPRDPSKGTRRSPPPIPPRTPAGYEPMTGNEELTNHEDSLTPPALPPKSRRS